jgi:hypothetical protein
MPGDPRWSGPPEAIAATFEAGSPASVVSNNLVWVTETAHHELAAGLSVANTAATQDSWAGYGSIASALAAAALNAGIHKTAGWTAHKIMVTQGAIDVFTTAQSSVVPSAVIKANRAERDAMFRANPSALWTLTSAIIERDIEYFGEHWPHNATVGWGYSSAMSAFTAALTIPPPLGPAGASPAAPAAAGAAVAQAAATTGAQDGVSLSGQAAQAAGQAASSGAGGAAEQVSAVTGSVQGAASSAIQPLAGIFQVPAQAAQAAGSLPQSLLGSLGGMFGPATAQEAAEVTPLAGTLGAAGSLGAGMVGSAGGGGAGAFPGAGLTSFTRPASTFAPSIGGRPAGLRVGAPDVGAVSSPTAPVGAGGTAMPMAPAAVARGTGEGSQKDAVAHARIVIEGDRTEPA